MTGSSNSFAILRICKTALVEPPIAKSAIIAFFSAPSAIIEETLLSFLTNLSVTTPGITEVPGSVIPMASAIICMVFAVPITGHAPKEAHAFCSISKSSWEFPSFFAAALPNTLSLTSDKTSSFPFLFPANIGPAVSNNDGMSSRAAAIKVPGTILSQPQVITTPSNNCILLTISMLLHTTSLTAIS